MSKKQALSLAILLLEFEIEQPAITPPPPDWEAELKAARAALQEMLGPVSPGRFFVSPEERRRALSSRGIDRPARP